MKYISSHNTRNYGFYHTLHFSSLLIMLLLFLSCRTNQWHSCHSEIESTLPVIHVTPLKAQSGDIVQRRLQVFHKSHCHLCEALHLVTSVVGHLHEVVYNSRLWLCLGSHNYYLRWDLVTVVVLHPLSCNVLGLWSCGYDSGTQVVLKLLATTR